MDYVSAFSRKNLLLFIFILIIIISSNHNLGFFQNKDCFRPGCGVQIRSKLSGGCLRVLPNGQVDCLGTLGSDYSGNKETKYKNHVSIVFALFIYTYKY